jgi:serine/threonine protein kinase
MFSSKPAVNPGPKVSKINGITRSKEWEERNQKDLVSSFSKQREMAATLLMHCGAGMLDVEGEGPSEQLVHRDINWTGDGIVLSTGASKMLSRLGIDAKDSTVAGLAGEASRMLSDEVSEILVSEDRKYVFVDQRDAGFSHASNPVLLGREMNCVDGKWLEGEKVVIKKLQRTPESEHEIRLLRGLGNGTEHGEKVVQLKAMGYSEKYYFCVLEHMAGTDCQKVLNKINEQRDKRISDKKMGERENRAALRGARTKTLALFVGALQAYKALGEEFVYHDLKLENLLYDPKKGVKLSDVGTVRGKDHILKGRGNQLVDNSYYKAPEIIVAEGVKNGAAVTQKADTWSFGVMLYKMLLNEFPFDPETSWDSDVMKLIERHAQGENVIDWSKFDRLGTDGAALKNLIQRMLSPKPEDRPSVDEVLADKALQKVIGSYDDTIKSIGTYIAWKAKPREGSGSGKKIQVGNNRPHRTKRLLKEAKPVTKEPSGKWLNGKKESEKPAKRSAKPVLRRTKGNRDIKPSDNGRSVVGQNLPTN